MNNIVTRNGTAYILVALQYAKDGSIDADMTAEFCRETCAAEVANASADFDTVATEVTTWLLSNPGLRNISVPAVTRAIYTARAENGDFKGKSQAEKDAVADRLAEVVPNYLRSKPDQFFIGRKSGVLFRFVDGEHVKDKDGNVLMNGNGEPVQAYRISDEDWKKATTPKKKDGDDAPESK